MLLTTNRVTYGKHTTFIHHIDGTVEMITDWDKLQQEIEAAIEALKKPVIRRKTKRGKTVGK